MALNLGQITTMTAVTNGHRLGTTNETTLFGPVPTDTAYRVTMLRASNFDGTNNQPITCRIHETGSPTIVADLANTITVPADASLNILENGELILTEGQSVVAQAGGADDISMSWSYVELS